MKASLLSLAAAAGSAVAKVSYAGVNIAGFDFGCTIDGNCIQGNVLDPNQAGLDQMVHFVKDDGLNTFRLPVGWQFLVRSQLGGNLDSTNFGAYDRLVQHCLNAGAQLCIIDIHNYARWNGQVVGQGGPSNDALVNLWVQLAQKYKSQPKVVFGIMNEPHDLDIATWGRTVQAIVTAIRQQGATQNKILLPGTNFAHATTILDDGGIQALGAVKNPDGSTTNLIFDVHAYLDSDGSGTHTSCTTNNVAAFQRLGDWLRSNKRQAFLTETGGGPNDSSCLEKLCQQFDVLNNYSDAYLGWVGWSAGKFDASYELTETPTYSNGKWNDVRLVTQCVAGKFK